jgi:hypothetical protein
MIIFSCKLHEMGSIKIQWVAIGFEPFIYEFKIHFYIVIKISVISIGTICFHLQIKLVFILYQQFFINHLRAEEKVKGLKLILVEYQVL